jgi:hypothetical protein
LKRRNRYETENVFHKCLWRLERGDARTKKENRVWEKEMGKSAEKEEE